MYVVFFARHWMHNSTHLHYLHAFLILVLLTTGRTMAEYGRIDRWILCKIRQTQQLVIHNFSTNGWYNLAILRALQLGLPHSVGYSICLFFWGPWIFTGFVLPHIWGAKSAGFLENIPATSIEGPGHHQRVLSEAIGSRVAQHAWESYEIGKIRGDQEIVNDFEQTCRPRTSWQNSIFLFAWLGSLFQTSTWDRSLSHNTIDIHLLSHSTPRSATPAAVAEGMKSIEKQLLFFTR